MDYNIRNATVDRFAELLAAKNQTISDLAYSSGVPESTIRHIFDGQIKNPGIATIKKLCDGLEINIVDYFQSELFRNLEQEIK